MVGDPGVGRRDVEISSMGGEVRLVVPDGLDMEVVIRLSYTRRHANKNYSIHTDFPLDIRTPDQWERKGGSPRKTIHGTGTIGAGTHKISIRTVNGNV